ncbi:MAG: hypothetical protein LUQ64_05015, partial [Methanomicrobiales archaeon]|nr:hypothetical protein [Methanomicrobiales archaeon]
PGTTWQSGTSGYLNYANPSGIDYVDGRLFLSSLHYWNKGDKWPPRPDGKCISGKKWEDKDGDGQKDADEPYIANWKITLYRWDGSAFVYMAETTTDQNGAYKFCNLPPCTYYKVVEEHQGGYIQTYPAAPGYWIVYLPVCTNQYDRNFGNRKVQSGKIVIIKDAVPDSPQDFPFTTTGGLVPPSFILDDDADPTYSNQQVFDNVAPGVYTVTEGAVAGWTLKEATCVSSLGHPETPGHLELEAGETITCTFKNEKVRGKIIIIKEGTSASCLAAPTNMVGWWAGDLSTDDLVDLNPGTLENGATYAPGKVEEAFSLDGADDYVRIPEAVSPLDGFGQLTLDAWVKADTLHPGDTMGLQTIVAKYDYAQANGISYWLGLMPDGKVRFAVYSGNAPGGNYAGVNVDTVDALSAGTMYHVAGVWDGVTTPVIYVNGVPKATTTTPGTSPMGAQVTPNAVPVTIGAVNGFTTANTPKFFFDGIIDEVEIFDRALSQSEIQKIVDADSDGKCKVRFPFIASPKPPLADFSLPLGGKMVFDQLDDGTYTVQETSIPYSWNLKNLVCVDPSDDTTIDLSTGTATIDLTNGEAVTCTYTNEQEKGRIIIRKAGECLFPPDEMTGWWPGDGNGNDLADGNPADLMNGATYGTGKVAQAFSLDGVDDGVEIAEDGTNLDGFTELTIDAWIYVDKPFSQEDNRRAIVAKYDSQQATDPSYALMVDGGKLQLMVFDTVGSPDAFWAYMTNDVVIQPQTWYHVAATWEKPDTFAIYVDGTATPGTLTTHGSPTGMRDSAKPVDIGRVRRTWPTVGFQGFFTGKIDEVEIFNRALSEGEIAAIHDAGDKGKCKPGDEEFGYTGDLGAFLLKMGKSTTFGDLAPGQYTVTESSLPTGWTLVDIVCVDGTGNTVVVKPSATIHLDDSETVTCTFTNKEELAEKTFTLTIPQTCPPGFEDGMYVTYTMGGWGAAPAGNNVGKLLADNFAAVYPSGVEIGIPDPGDFSMKFTSASAIENYLPAGGTADKLTSNHVDP